MPAKFRLGIDIGGNDIKFGATNLEADKILLPDLVKRPSLSAEGPQRTIRQTLDGIKDILISLRGQWPDVATIAVTVPCPCTSDGVIIEATNLGTPETKKLWQAPFGELLAAEVRKVAQVSIPVFACNDANAAGQDDDFARYGQSTSPRTNFFITTGTGLGGCILVNGAVFFGRGQSGELGHVKPAVPAQYAARFAADPNPPCGCGGRQCVEARASLKGLMRRLEWALGRGGISFIEQDLNGRGEELNGNVLAQLSARFLESPQSAA
ncbi:MAG: ROK family protein [Gemmataceae bacterium]|nr:ROK family protein [Gemmataceae bacterium]MCI0738885.1 ROK family protein [Gemmataceae bacterium]